MTCEYSTESESLPGGELARKERGVVSTSPPGSDSSSGFPGQSHSSEEARPQTGQDSFHDGGSRGWTCVLGGFCALFCTFGWLNSYVHYHHAQCFWFTWHFTYSFQAWIVSDILPRNSSVDLQCLDDLMDIYNTVVSHVSPLCLATVL